MGEKDKQSYDVLNELLAAMQNWDTPADTSLGQMTGGQFFTTAIARLRASGVDLNAPFMLQGQSGNFSLLRAASYYGNAQAVEALAQQGASPAGDSVSVFYTIKGLLDSPNRSDPATQEAYKQTFNALAANGADLGDMRQKLEGQAAAATRQGGKEAQQAALYVEAFNAFENNYRNTASRGPRSDYTVQDLPQVSQAPAAPAAPAPAARTVSASPASGASRQEQAWAEVDAIRENIRSRLDPQYHGTLMQATAASDDPAVTVALNEVCAQLSEQDQGLVAQARAALHEGGLMEPEKPEKPAAKPKGKRGRD